jgi:hypothetical protein
MRFSALAAVVLTGVIALPALPQPNHQLITVITEGSVVVNDRVDRRGPGRRPVRNVQDTLRTGYGRAEVQISPGVGLWIGGNTLVWMSLLDPLHSKVELLSGTIVLEAIRLQRGATTTIVCNRAKVSIGEPGLYMVHADPAELLVVRGRALAAVLRRKIEVSESEMLSLDSSSPKGRFYAASVDALNQYLRWRARHGEPGSEVFPGARIGGLSGGSISIVLPGTSGLGGGGRMSSDGGGRPVGGLAGRGGFQRGGIRFTPGGRGGGGGGGPDVLSLGRGSVFLNDRALDPDAETSARMKEQDVLRTAQDRARVWLAPGTSLWVGRSSLVKMGPGRPPDFAFEIPEGMAVLDVSAMGVMSLKFNWRDWTIFVMEPGVYRMDANPAGIRVFEGKVLAQSAGRSVEVGKGQMLGLDASAVPAKFDRKKTDSLDAWRGWKADRQPNPSFGRGSTGGWSTIGFPPF